MTTETVTVPREPTPAMIDAGRDAYLDAPWSEKIEPAIYRAMIACAPAIPADGAWNALEALWKAVLELERRSFILTPEGNGVRAVKDSVGRWLEKDEVGQLFEAAIERAALSAPPLKEETGEPVAWAYRMASNYSVDAGYHSFEKELRFSPDRPCAPEGAIRDLTPLYAAPPAPADLAKELEEARADVAFWKKSFQTESRARIAAEEMRARYHSECVARRDAEARLASTEAALREAEERAQRADKALHRISNLDPEMVMGVAQDIARAASREEKPNV